LSGAQFLLTDNVLVQTVAQAPVCRTAETGGAPGSVVACGDNSAASKQYYPLGVIRSLGWVRCGISSNTAIDGVNLSQFCSGKPKGTLYLDDGTHDGCGDAGMPH
jgi:hypothetical protein